MRWRRGIGFLLTVLAAAAAGAADSPATDDASAAAAWIAAADEALADLDQERALSGYRAARELAPQNAAAAWKLARALIYEDILSTNAAESSTLGLEAAALAREAIRIDPTSPMGHTFLAVATGRLADRESGSRRRMDLARETWSEAQQAVRADLAQDLALHVLGIWHREIAAINPLTLFAAQLLYGRLPPASIAASVEYLRQAVELQPAAIPHRVELGVSLAAAKRWDEARVQLEAALALPDGLVIDNFYRARARQALGLVREHLRGGPQP